MIYLLSIASLLVFMDGFQPILGQAACPTATHTVASKFVISAPPDDSIDNIQKLPGCLGLQTCQMTSVQWGQCGSAKVQTIEGAQKAATVSLSPAGCTEVYNCNGIFVDAETYNAVTGEACSTTNFGGQSAAVCAGVLLPSMTLQAITGGQCEPVKNCSQLRKRQLLAASGDLKCSSVKVTLAAQSQTQATLIQQKLQGAGALSELGTCLGTQLASIGPNRVTPLPGP
eukprot:jgi/Botrbrau1/18660/Bobra.0452s0002.1